MKRRIDIFGVPHKSLERHDCAHVLPFGLPVFYDLFVPFVYGRYFLSFQQLNRFTVEVISAVHGIRELLLILTLESLHVLLMVLHLVIVKAVGRPSERQRFRPVKLPPTFF